MPKGGVVLFDMSATSPKKRYFIRLLKSITRSLLATWRLRAVNCRAM
jgi:hypothetical protein